MSALSVELWSTYMCQKKLCMGGCEEYIVYVREMAAVYLLVLSLPLVVEFCSLAVSLAKSFAMSFAMSRSLRVLFPHKSPPKLLMLFEEEERRNRMWSQTDETRDPALEHPCDAFLGYNLPHELDQSRLCT